MKYLKIDFKIDPKYVCFKCMEGLLGTIVGLYIFHLGLSNNIELYFYILQAAFLIGFFLIIFYPRIIVISNGYLNFTDKYIFNKQRIKLEDIDTIEVKGTVMKRVVVTTKTSHSLYNLHPKHPYALISELQTN